MTSTATRSSPHLQNLASRIREAVPEGGHHSEEEFTRLRNEALAVIKRVAVADVLSLSAIEAALAKVRLFGSQSGFVILRDGVNTGNNLYTHNGVTTTLFSLLINENLDRDIQAELDRHDEAYAKDGVRNIMFGFQLNPPRTGRPGFSPTTLRLILDVQRTNWTTLASRMDRAREYHEHRTSGARARDTRDTRDTRDLPRVGRRHGGGRRRDEEEEEEEGDGEGAEEEEEGEGETAEESDEPAQRSRPPHARGGGGGYRGALTGDEEVAEAEEGWKQTPTRRQGSGSGGYRPRSSRGGGVGGRGNYSSRK